MCRWQLVLALILPLAAFAADRSPATVRAFRAEHPCPSTGKTRGACPGWQVDHVQALVCGGPDTVDNLQWLAVDAHKEKTPRDMRGCRARPK